jgi:methylthioribose-1-phosphate isomerase
MIVRAVKWVGGVNGYLSLVDQRQLPGKFVKLQCRSIEHLYKAIRTLAIRGAPVIGVAAAYGLVLAMQKSAASDSLQEGLKVLGRSCKYLASSRPTAVNLFWALDRVRQSARQYVVTQMRAKPSNINKLRKAVLTEANSIYQEDVDMCRRIGQNGQKFIKDGFGILTHCNAGALATAGQGTALSVIFEAHKKGKKFTVYVDETRPMLQGARLTAWELKRAGIDVVVICDNVAGWLMKQGKIDAVITGADRIAANGDVANKIGTYSLSILARARATGRRPVRSNPPPAGWRGSSPPSVGGIPFYIAAPSSTFDLSIKTGAEIPIEQRPAAEVIRLLRSKTQIVPAGVKVYNPAFDVTEAHNITAIITERGVIENPNVENISEHFGLILNPRKARNRGK